MIINRIKLNDYSTTLCGLSIDKIQERFLSINDIISPRFIKSTSVECLIYDDLPLLSGAFLYRLKKKCLENNVGYKLGKGYIKKAGCDGKLLPTRSYFATPYTPVRHAFFIEKLNNRIVNFHKHNGVIFYDERSVLIDFDVTIEKGAVIKGNTSLEGNAKIGACVIESSKIVNSTVLAGTSVGPFAYIRQNSVIGENCRIGDFVEIKNSVLGKGVKCAHLAYVGDATVGDGTNIGCGTVFCNYDGTNKHRTEIGKNVFIGANTNLIAPLTVSDGVFIAAGSTVDKNVDANSFVIARSRMTVKNDKLNKKPQK